MRRVQKAKELHGCHVMPPLYHYDTFHVLELDSYSLFMYNGNNLRRDNML